MRHPFFQEAIEMPLVQRNNEVQTLSPHRSNDAFANSIRHRRLYRCFEHMQPHMTHALVNLFGKDGIAVMNEHAICMVSRDCFTELLGGPRRRGMRRDIDVQESAARMLNDQKHIEETECRGNRHAEVARDDAFGVIMDKRRPALRLTAFARAAYTMTWHVFAHRSR